MVANFRRYHAFLRILVQSLRNGIFWEWEKFLSHFFCSATDLPVLASVEDGPCHLPGVALEHVCLLGTTVQETESLKIRELNFFGKTSDHFLLTIYYIRYSSTQGIRTIVRSTEHISI